jgi:hypothetical protein
MSYWTRLQWLWNPTGSWMCLAGRICPTKVGYVQPNPTVMTLEPDLGPDMPDASDMSDMELMPRLWNPMEISDLVEYVRSNIDKTKRKDLEF